MEEKLFIPENIYFLETTIDPEVILLINGDYQEFSDLNLSISNTIGEIKEKIEGILNKNINYGQSSLDYMSDNNESKLLNTTLDKLTLHYDWSIFDNVIIITGTELNNLSQDIVITPM
jgi:hypothetical protein